MYPVRVVMTLLIILAMVAAYNPQAHEQAARTWENIKSTGAGITSSLYVTIHNFLEAGSRDEVDETPVPDPRIHFDRIVTLNTGNVF